MNQKGLVGFLKFRTKKNDQRRWNCPDEGQMAAFADQRLTGPAKDKLESHLADCDFCLGQVAFLVRMQKAALPEPVSNALLLRAKRLVGGKSQAKGSSLWLWVKISAATATACLALLVEISLRQPQLVTSVTPQQNQAKLTAQIIPQVAPKKIIAPPLAVRGGSKPAFEPSVLIPTAGQTVTSGGIELRWRAVQGTRDYEVKLLTAEGDLVWTQSTAASSLRLPAEVKLDAGKRYFVQVRANLAAGKSVQSAPVAFTVASR